MRSFEQLALAAGLINLLVVGVINPLRNDRCPDAFPAILQDAIIIGLFAVVATFVFDDKLLTTSAVGAAIVGFALQDTLGNAFAGLAIQSEKPFRVGAWIRVGEFEGRVTEVTWRATKLRTKAGNFVVVPNNIVAKEAITNYSEPIVPTRLEVEVGASYLSTPGDVKKAILEAVANVPRALQTPPPDALLHSFDGSAITYRARFWIDNYEMDEIVRDEVRTAIFYAFGRHGIEIPWPIEVGYEREWPEPDPAAKQRAARSRSRARRSLRAVDGRTPARDRSRDVRSCLRSRRADRSTGIRRAVDVRRLCGTVDVVLEPDRRHVATIEARRLLRRDVAAHRRAADRDGAVGGRYDRPRARRRRLPTTRRRGSARHRTGRHRRRRAGVSSSTRARDSARIAATGEAPATLLGRMKRFLGMD